MSITLEQAQQLITETIHKLRTELPQSEWERGQLHKQFREVYTNYDITSLMYSPSDNLIKRISDYFDWKEGKRSEDMGRLMEELASLAFGSLVGWDNISSYQSYAAQHDIVISGSTNDWYDLMEYLHLPKSGRTIVIEAKNLSEKVDDQQFSRLCSIIHNKFEITCHLGVFFSKNGATGFDSKRVLRDARATQVLFHAKTCKFVIVLTEDDFDELQKKGGLPKLLEARILDVEAVSNIQLDYNGRWEQAELPKHIAQHFPSATTSSIASV